MQVLQPYGSAKDASTTPSRLYAAALILNNKADEGRKILEALPVGEDPSRQVAKSGALARTIEYYIAEKDYETGQQQWNAWQDQFPIDFMEGYSVLLETKLMEVNNVPQSAARLAEAFATSVPGSSYSPQLLFRAAKLLEKTDPAHSAVLIHTLKERYPEDPLKSVKHLDA